MFFKNKEEDINIKSAFLHLASDALLSLGLVVGGIVIHYTKLYWIDPILSLVVCVVIIVSTWQFLKNSLRLSLNGVPQNVDIEKIKSTALKLNGIIEIHHIHVWAISTTQNALTAHIIVNEKITMPQIQEIKEALKHQLLHQNIHHITLETETKNGCCDKVDC